MSGAGTGTVLLLGATGLVGVAALELLLADPRWSAVRILVRRPPGQDRPRLRVRVLEDFANLDAATAEFAVNAVLCAVGTTIQAAGSQAAFRAVDHDIPVAAAQLARAQGAAHFGLVSSLGADPRSRVFYSRVKGEVEEEVRRLGPASIAILRPSLLLGPRREFRLGEALAKPLGFLIPGRYRPVQAAAVARVLVDAAMLRRPGVEVIESVEIRRRGGGT